MSDFFFDTPIEKGRLYRRGDWFEFVVNSKVADKDGDFMRSSISGNAEFLGLTDDDVKRAILRKK